MLRNTADALYVVSSLLFGMVLRAVATVFAALGLVAAGLVGAGICYLFSFISLSLGQLIGGVVFVMLMPKFRGWGGKVARQP